MKTVEEKIAAQQAECDEYNRVNGVGQYALTNELEFLDSVWRNDEVPLRLRVMCASEVARYRNATMRATAQVTRNDMASELEKARLRAATVANVIRMKPRAIEHAASELRPAPSSAENNGGFRRRF